MMRIALLVGLVIGCGSSPPAAPVAPAIPAAGDSEVDLGLLQKGSPSQAKLARLRLIHANTLDARQKVQALSLFVDDKDREAVRILCQRTNDASIAWPCLQYGALKLESSLGLIAELPVFGYDEFRRLANTPDAARINGLRCLEAGARSEGLQPMFDRVFRSTEDVPPVLVTIYHRASRDAPEPTATCLLEEASFL